MKRKQGKAEPNSRSRRRVTLRSGWLVGLGVGLLGLAAFAARAASDAPARLREALPAERTLWYAQIESVGAIRHALEGGELERQYTALRPFVDALRKGLEAPWREALRSASDRVEFPVDRLLEALAGGVECALVWSPSADEPGGIDPSAPIGVLAVDGEHARVLDLIAKRIKERVADDAVVIERLERNGRALLVVGGKGEALWVSAERSEQPLAKASSWRTIRRRAWGEDAHGLAIAYFGIDVLERIMPAPERERFERTGLSGIDALGLGVSVRGGHPALAFAVSHPGPRRGLVKILAGARALDPLAIGERTPAHVEALGALSIEPRALWEELTALAERFDPNARERIEQRLLELETELGFSPVDDVLSGLGGPIVLESIVPEGGSPWLTEMVVSAKVQDVARLERALEAAADRLDMEVRSLEVEGTAPVRYLSMRPGRFGQDPERGYGEKRLGVATLWSALAGAWTIEGDRIYLSALPQTLLERRAHRLPSLAERESFKRVAARVPGGSRAFFVVQPGRGMGALMHLATRVLRSLEPALRRAGIPVDAALLPPPGRFAKSFDPVVVSWQVGRDGMTLRAEGSLPVVGAAALTLGGLGAAYNFGPGAVDRAPRRLPPAMEGPRFACPMHPQIEARTPGRCPICHMQLEPSTAPKADDDPPDTAPKPDEEGRR